VFHFKTIGVHCRPAWSKPNPLLAKQKFYDFRACAVRKIAAIIPLLGPPLWVVVLLQAGSDSLCGDLRWRDQETSQKISQEIRLTTGFLFAQGK
jgi:hypothetical protein